jgi:hypothetical protein
MLPPYLLQAAPGQETDACEAFSLCNYIYLKTGWLPSMVDLARISDLENPDDEHAQIVLDAANNIGLVDYGQCPLPSPLTVSAFYSNSPANLKRQKLNIVLDNNPNDRYLWTWLQWGSNLAQPTNHMVVMINDGSGDFIDSEPGGQIKNINKPTIEGGAPAKIMWQSSIIINKKPLMNEAVLVKSKKSNTIYWCYPMPDMDYMEKKANLEGVVVPSVIPDSDSL